MVAGALLSDSFAVLALACYILISLIVGLLSQLFPDFVGIRKAQKAVSQMRDGRVGDRRRGCIPSLLLQRRQCRIRGRVRGAGFCNQVPGQT